MNRLAVAIHSVLTVFILVALAPNPAPLNAGEFTHQQYVNESLCRLRYIQRIHNDQIYELARIQTGLIKGEDPAYVADKVMRDASRKLDKIDEACGGD